MTINLQIGAGKSSLVDRVFRFGEEKPVRSGNDFAFYLPGRLLTKTVEDWTPGQVDILKEFTSQGNVRFVLHDSEGFGPGNEESFTIVDTFIRERRKETLHPKDQLHVIW